MRRPIALLLAAMLVASPSLAQSEPAGAPAPEPAATAIPVSPTPPPDRLDEPPPRPLARHRSRFSASLEAGYGYQNLYVTPINGVDITAVLGADLGPWGVAMVLDFDRGWTVDGLRTTTTGIGPLIEGHAGRFRFGGGVRLGTFNVARVTSDSSLFTMSTGVYGRASLDLVTFESEGGGAVFLVLKGSVDTVGTALYGVTGGLGVRF